MDVVADIRRIAAAMERLGHRVEFVPGWETRGSGNFAAIDVALDHHDAFPARSGHAGGLRTCTFGRPDLRNSLCMFYLGSDGTTWVVAARVSWHAGKGHLTTNSRSRGIEARNDGVGEPWPEVQLAAYADLDALAVEVWGCRVADHKEHSSTGKIDRTGIDPHAWRRRVDARRPAARLALAGGTPTPTPIEEPLMVTADDEQKIRKIVHEEVKPILDALAGVGRKAVVVRDPRDRKAWVITETGRWHVPDRTTLDVLVWTGQVAPYGGQIPEAAPAWLDQVPIVDQPARAS